MAFVVGHENNGAAKLDVVLALLAAGKQARDQAAAEQAAPDLIEQLQQVSNGGSAGRLRQAGRSRSSQYGVPELTDDGTGQPAYGVRPRSQQPQYSRAPSRSGSRSSGGGSGYGGGGGLYSLIGDDPRLANQNLLAQFRAEQQAQLQDDRQAQELTEAAMQQSGVAIRQQTQDPPEWIQRGISEGSLRYSPMQQRERQQLLDSIDKVYNDPRWSQDQRARFEAQQRYKIRQIDLAPQEVPINERPVSPQQQFEQSVVTWTDPETGQKVSGFMGVRNGAPDFKPFKEDTSAKDQAKAQFEQQKFDAKQAADEQKLYRDAAHDDMRGQHEERMLNRQQRADAMRMRAQLQTDIARAQGILAKEQAAAAKEGLEVNFKSAKDEITKLSEMLESIVVPPEWSPPIPQSGLPAIQPMTPGVSMESTPTDAIEQPPMQDGRAVINSEADGIRYKLKSGTPVIDSNGRTGTWQ